MFSRLLCGWRRLFLLLVILGWVLFHAGISWAVREPDVIAVISQEGVTVQGDMLANVQYGWYPGQKKEGLLRLRNDASRALKIEALEADVVIKDAFGSLIDESDYNYAIYAVTIKEGAEVLYPKMGEPRSLVLGKGAFIDLEYRIEMDERCGNELQGSKARIAIIAKIVDPAEE